MNSLVSSLLYNSAIKIENMSKRTQPPPSSIDSSRYSNSSPPPPPYDPPVIPTPSTSWTLEMSALAEKIKDHTFSQGGHIDRHSISQGMKLVSIAADEYEQGHESTALDIYLTGVDKVLMALPNKTDMHTKRAIGEKLQSIQEKVGIVSVARESPPSMDHQHHAMNQFKQWGQSLVETAVTVAILIKKSPLPDLVWFIFGYIAQVLMWINAHYHFIERLQEWSIQSIKYVLEAEEKYRLHEFVSEGIYMMVAAVLKATVAFKETPAASASKR
ncbi:uncharacterized protein EV154DRAFT_489446 [Mucor mucedo]|uniref:uncharacterized protein n=1 Tax=Mucor mucedo TaxID=29922 RepID=UPI00221EE230|nr:uncharacterized protein EV154DRAFT_489446 [Mucor mucedo]KAI7897249.1 hypothetical protein EV154DRAFT_489446 [Mucor mucedo]